MLSLLSENVKISDTAMTNLAVNWISYRRHIVSSIRWSSKKKRVTSSPALLDIHFKLSMVYLVLPSARLISQYQGATPQLDVVSAQTVQRISIHKETGVFSKLVCNDPTLCPKLSAISLRLASCIAFILVCSRRRFPVLQTTWTGYSMAFLPGLD